MLFEPVDGLLLIVSLLDEGDDGLLMLGAVGEVVDEPVEPVPVPESVFELGVDGVGVVVVLSLGLVVVLGGVPVEVLGVVMPESGVRPVLSAFVSAGAVVAGPPGLVPVPVVPVPEDCA
jgi:hypothetical protein